MGFFNPSPLAESLSESFTRARPDAREFHAARSKSTRRDPRARGAMQENAMVWAALGSPGCEGRFRIAWKMIWPGRLDRR
ncbi:protein of unknown function [Methylocella tundrae]|uniref:Uncharacterized protein n=1 Tax=Methylocella tundrae TaxID=227605 RepID=A0A4U8YVD7_METTU|nr:protein of unknown function [Methylocella tundrae]